MCVCVCVCVCVSHVCDVVVDLVVFLSLWDIFWTNEVDRSLGGRHVRRADVTAAESTWVWSNTLIMISSDYWFLFPSSSLKKNTINEGNKVNNDQIFHNKVWMCCSCCCFSGELLPVECDSVIKTTASFQNCLIKCKQWNSQCEWSDAFWVVRLHTGRKEGGCLIKRVSTVWLRRSYCEKKVSSRFFYVYILFWKDGFICVNYSSCSESVVSSVRGPCALWVM